MTFPMKCTSQRHNLPPTLEIITHNFPKFSVASKNFHRKKSKIFNFPLKISKLQRGRHRDQIIASKFQKFSFFLENFENSGYIT